MLKRFLNKFRPALSFDQLKALSESAVKNIVDGNDQSLDQIRKGIEIISDGWPEYKEELHKYLDDHLERLANTNSRSEQILLLRELTVEALERSANTMKYINREEDDRRILAEILEKDTQFEDFESQQAIVRLNNEVSCYCFRSISLYLGDVKHNDWFDVYGRLNPHQIEMFYNSIIADKKNESYSLSVMLPVLKDSVDSYRSKILRGEDLQLTDAEMATVTNGLKSP